MTSAQPFTPALADAAPGNDALTAELAAELAALAALDLAGLRARWRRLTRKPAPPALGRALLLRLTAYTLQARALGDLDRETARTLDAVHRDQQRERERRRDGKGGLDGAGPPRAVPLVLAVPDARRGRLKPGTLLVREHRGRVHRVMVLERGFAHEGATYASLSEIARLITGTSWNGPRFFGLRERRTTRSAPRSAATVAQA